MSLPARIEPGVSPALADQWEADALGAIASVQTPEDAEEILRRVKAVEAAMRLSELSQERAERWMAVKLRAERKYGELLGPASNQGRRTDLQPVTSSHRLDAAGRKEQQRARQVAAVPEETFEEYVETTTRPSRAGLLATAAEPQPDDALAVRQRQQRAEHDAYMRSLLPEPDGVQRSILASKLATHGEAVAREHAASMDVAYPDDLEPAAGASEPLLPATSPHPPREDAGWSGFERRARREVERGRAVAAHIVNHPNLIAWAKERGCFKLVDGSTEWGNPFRRGEDGDHETVARLFADHYMPFKVALRRRLPELHGRVLGAYDAPEPGHAQVLAELANDCRADRRAA